MLSDGFVLREEDPVLELHVHSGRLLTLIKARDSWRAAVEEEFRSMSGTLEHRPEVAIVGTTILVDQVHRFGGTTRP